MSARHDGVPARRGSRRARAAVGFANASPTTTSRLMRSRATADHSSSGSSERFSSSTAVPPSSCGTIMPSQQPVPCMSGGPDMLTVALPRARNSCASAGRLATSAHPAAARPSAGRSSGRSRRSPASSTSRPSACRSCRRCRTCRSRRPAARCAPRARACAGASRRQPRARRACVPSGAAPSSTSTSSFSFGMRVRHARDAIARASSGRRAPRSPTLSSRYASSSSR